VYKVRKRLDGWVYAVKRSRHSLETEGEREAAMREVFALAALQGCPQLVRYLGAWMEEKHLYIQTEFCPGGSLERAVFPRGSVFGAGPQQPQPQQPPPPPPQGGEGSSSGFDGSEEALLRVARDVASALQFMHTRGIVHMDVKVRACRLPLHACVRACVILDCGLYRLSTKAGGGPVVSLHADVSPPFHAARQPGNILLAGDGSFKLGDLGHAIKADGSMVVAEGDERYLSMDVLKVRPCPCLPCPALPCPAPPSPNANCCDSLL
jgi:serine/threonine protein kinase